MPTRTVFHRISRPLLIAIGLTILVALPCELPALSLAAPPALTAKSAILIDEDTGRVLYAHNADEPFPPASLTKMVTLEIVLDQIDEGLLDPAQIVVPKANAWAVNQPAGSSLMFLGPNQRLSIQQLLEGLTIASGNDAAVELADLVAGSVPDFVELMNQEVERLGFSQMHFVDPAGIHSANRITAREYAEFCRRFIRLHPDALPDLLSVKKIVYPLPDNLTNGDRQQPIVQFNRNLLLWKDEGVDGLKTGYIDQSGYNSAVTAERDGMRLIAVILGIPGHIGDPAAERQRELEGESLLNWGFASFALVRPTYDSPRLVRVWKGREKWVDLAPSSEPVAVVPRSETGGVTCSLRQESEAIAPIREGQVLGHLVVTSDGKELAAFPLEAAHPVARGGIFRRAVDSTWLWARGFFGSRPRVESSRTAETPTKASASLP